MRTHDPIEFEPGDVKLVMVMEGHKVVVRPCIMLNSPSEDQYEVLVGLAKRCTSSSMIWDDYEAADCMANEIESIAEDVSMRSKVVETAEQYQHRRWKNETW